MAVVDDDLGLSHMPLNAGDVDVDGLQTDLPCHAHEEVAVCETVTLSLSENFFSRLIGKPVVRDGKLGQADDCLNNRAALSGDYPSSSW